MANKKPSLYRKRDDKKSLYRKTSERSSWHRKNRNKQTLYRKTQNQPSLYRQTMGQYSANQRAVRGRNRRQSPNTGIGQLFSNLGQIDLLRLLSNRTVRIIGIIILALLIISLIGVFTSPNSDSEKTISPSTTIIGNNSLGTVYKIGPYGNTSSNVTVSYILGVHPREQGAHQKMEKAFKIKANGLKYKYYLYKINVTSDSTDYAQSRANGQNLANEYVVPDAISNNVSFAVDCHYSNGNWGVARFVFSPRENNTLSTQLGHALADNFDWLVYFVPNNPTSPEYVTGPLNDGGVASIVYEAYTEDGESTTVQHAKEMIDFIDNWDFSK